VIFSESTKRTVQQRYVFLEEIALLNKTMEFSAVLDNHFGFSSLQFYLIIANRLQSFKWQLLNESVLLFLSNFSVGNSDSLKLLEQTLVSKQYTVQVAHNSRSLCHLLFFPKESLCKFIT